MDGWLTNGDISWQRVYLDFLYFFIPFTSVEAAVRLFAAVRKVFLKIRVCGEVKMRNADVDVNVCSISILFTSINLELKVDDRDIFALQWILTVMT